MQGFKLFFYSVSKDRFHFLKMSFGSGFKPRNDIRTINRKRIKKCTGVTECSVSPKNPQDDRGGTEIYSDKSIGIVLACF